MFTGANLTSTKLFIIQAIKDRDGGQEVSFVCGNSFDGGLPLSGTVTSAKIYTEVMMLAVMAVGQRGTKYAPVNGPLLKAFEITLTPVDFE